MKLVLAMLPLAMGQFFNFRPPMTPTKVVKKPVTTAIQPARPMMDPMMMMLLMNKNSKSTDNNLLLIMMMMGGMNGQGGGQPMNPMMMSLLLKKKASDCKLSFTSAFTKLSLTDQKKMARGDYFYKLPVASKLTASTKYAAETTITGNANFATTISKVSQTLGYPLNWMDHLDYDFISCEAKANKKTTTDTMLPLMMMNSAGGSGMDPMMMLMLLGDSTMNDLLPIMMMSKQQAGMMDPMFMTVLLDTKKTKVDCDAEYYLDKSFDFVQDTTDKDLFTISKQTVARKPFDKNHMTTIYTLKDGKTKIDAFATVRARTLPAAYIKCLNAATTEGTTKSSLSKLLPLMMMGQNKPGQSMNMFSNPWMMMLLLKK